MTENLRTSVNVCALLNKTVTENYILSESHLCVCVCVCVGVVMVVKEHVFESLVCFYLLETMDKSMEMKPTLTQR